MPSVKVVNGKQIVVEALDPAQRLQRFLAKPFLQMIYNKEIVLAVLRRELRARFTGSAGGWLSLPGSRVCACADVSRRQRLE